MDALDDLRRIAPPPAEPTGRCVDPERVRAQLGIELPEDYLALAREWGAGEFDAFIGINEPGHPNPNLALVEQARDWSWVLRQRRDQGEQVLPFPAEIEPGGLLAWGRPSTAIRASASAVEGPGLVGRRPQEARGPDWHVFEGGLVEFLVAVLEGRERVSLFPEDVPSDEPRFARA